MPCFLSHRGESDDAPENTLEAFQLAMARDSDGIELDIRLTADGEVVCVHDESLKRVAGVDLAVATNTLKELRLHHPLPLLAEALDCLKPGKHMQIELKGSPEQIAPLSEVLRNRRGDHANLALSSFEEETIFLAADRFPMLPRIFLTNLARHFGKGFPDAAQTAELLTRLRCTGISFLATTDADATFVDTLHKKGFRVVCWGVSSDELGLAMARIGVDAMTCNHAVALREKWRNETAGNALPAT